MSSTTPPPGNPPNEPIRFDANSGHHQQPKIRAVRAFPAQIQTPEGGVQQAMGLVDARQISDRPPLVVSPAVQAILPLMDGVRSVDQIVAEVGRGLERPVMEQLVAQLDTAGLLEGPNFDRMLAKMRADFDASDVLPPSGTAAFADSLVVAELGKEATDEQKAEHGPRKIREAFDKWMADALAKAENPSFDDLPRAIAVPHLDYGRGWINYATVYGRMRVCDRPDRVIILGTNHFGSGTGVVGCDKGYETPLGTCSLATDVEAAMRSRLGDVLFQHRYDHEREHSIELQIPWIQHVFGGKDGEANPAVCAFLVHDPTVNDGQSYDGQGVGIEPFVEALRETIQELPGRTLIVCSADLSHVGPAFGDKQSVAGEDEAAAKMRARVVQHDQSMLRLLGENKPAELVSSMAWQQNPTRWCSIGNLTAGMLAAQPREVEIFNYAAVIDQQGMAMVSSVAMAMR